MSNVNSKKQTDLECCTVCSMVELRTPTTVLAMVKMDMCDLCINAHFQEYELKPQMQSCCKMKRNTSKWQCTGCYEQQEESAVVHDVTFCIRCLLVFMIKRDEILWDSLKKDQEAKISFLQYEPSLRTDFVGKVSFVVGGSGERIEAHRFVLMSKSPVLRAMMEIDMKEKLTGIIHIEGMSAAFVRAAVNFMYRGEIEFHDQVLPEEVLRFAHQYEIRFLKVLCEKELVGKVTTENFAKMISIGDEFGLEMLKDKATECFTKCFVDHPSDHKALLETLLRTAI